MKKQWIIFWVWIAVNVIAYLIEPLAIAVLNGIVVVGFGGYLLIKKCLGNA